MYLLASDPSIQNPEVTIPGVYTLTFTASDACTATANALVTNDQEAPDLFLIKPSDTLDCFVISLSLVAISNTPDVIYSWLGPNGFMSNQESPKVEFSVTYTLVLTAPNGCSHFATIHFTTLLALATELQTTKAEGKNLIQY